MIKGKTRHQLYLPLDLSRQLDAMAKSQKRARSDLLAEIAAWYLTRRLATNTDDRVSAKLDEIERSIEKIDSETVIMSHSLSRFIRHQLIYAAALPAPGKDAEALGEKRYQAFLDSVARLMARVTDTQDDELPAEAKVRPH